MDTPTPIAIVQISLAVSIGLLCGVLLVITRQAQRAWWRRFARKRRVSGGKRQEQPDHAAVRHRRQPEVGAERDAPRLSIHHSGPNAARIHRRGSDADRVN